MTFKLPYEFTGLFNYVDCGAAGDLAKPLSNIFIESRYIGFDPEIPETQESASSSIFFPVALAGTTGEVEFYRTNNPNCSSVFMPNHQFLEHFMKVGDYFKIIETKKLNVVTLDEYLPEHGISDIDFIELDTQGSELDILHGAENKFLPGILGIRIEVEFAEMYHKQPLFGDVDSFLRQHGFMLFDLDRYHLRRKTSSNDFSREQIVWGQALYLKDWNWVHEKSMKQKLSKLAMIASFYGFHSYAKEVLTALLTNETSSLTMTEATHLRETLDHYQDTTNIFLIKDLKVFIKNLYACFKNALFQIGFFKNMQRKNTYFWVD